MERPSIVLWQLAYNYVFSFPLGVQFFCNCQIIQLIIKSLFNGHVHSLYISLTKATFSDKIDESIAIWHGIMTCSFEKELTLANKFWSEPVIVIWTALKRLKYYYWVVFKQTWLVVKPSPGRIGALRRLVIIKSVVVVVVK